MLYGQVVYLFSRASTTGDVFLITVYRAETQQLRAISLQGGRINGHWLN